MERHDWTIIAVRTCITCNGTGKNPPPPRSPGGQQTYSIDSQPVECPTCKGERVERKPYTLSELASELRSL